MGIMEKCLQNQAIFPLKKSMRKEKPLKNRKNAEIPIDEEIGGGDQENTIEEIIPIEEIGAEEEIVEKTENAEILIPEVVPESPKDIVKIEPARIESISDDDDEEEDEDDDFEDETIIERLVGLTEMF